MPTTKEYTVYTYDELSDRAKERARDWYREGQSRDFEPDYIYDDAATIADLMGFDIKQKPVRLMNGKTRLDPAIYYSGFGGQSDGACFEGRWYGRDVQPGKTVEHAPQDEELAKIAAVFERVAKECPDAWLRAEHTGRYYHEHSVAFEGDAAWQYDAEPMPDDYDADALVEELKDAARDFMRWIYRRLESEYEYQTSDEVAEEGIRANGYTFDEDGNRED